MNRWYYPPFCRGIAWLVIVAMLAPVFAGCVTTPGSGFGGSAEIMLDGIVVDGQRRAAPGETGLVWVVRGAATIQANPGMVLHIGDRVFTGPNADAVIRYPSGTEVLMRPRSSGRVGSFSDVIGEIFVKVHGLFTAETTFVKAGARGTAFLLRSGTGGTTTVIVFDGTVVVESTSGAWAPVTLGPGWMAIAHPGAPRPLQAAADELQRTREWVERVERLVPPRAGVSGGVIVGAILIGALVAAILASPDRNSGRERPGDSPLPRPRPPAPTPTPSPPAGTPGGVR